MAGRDEIDAAYWQSRYIASADRPGRLAAFLAGFAAGVISTIAAALVAAAYGG